MLTSETIDVPVSGTNNIGFQPYKPTKVADICQISADFSSLTILRLLRITFTERLR